MTADERRSIYRCNRVMKRRNFIGLLAGAGLAFLLPKPKIELPKLDWVVPGRPVDSIPAGTITYYAGNTVPFGWDEFHPGVGPWLPRRPDGSMYKTIIKL